MTLTPANPVAIAPFSRLSLTAPTGSGVRITPRDGLGIATVLARRNASGALASRLRERLGIELPRQPARMTAGEVAIVGTGPNAWLALHETAGNAFVATLREAIGDAASICDQSDGLAVIRVSGPRVRDALRKLVPIDLHPRVFEPGAAAVTQAGHVGATLWRLHDLAEGISAFEIAVLRSYAPNFWHALCESSAEFGCDQG